MWECFNEIEEFGEKNGEKDSHQLRPMERWKPVKGDCRQERIWKWKEKIYFIGKTLFNILIKCQHLTWQKKSRNETFWECQC